jgi:hypothetical protein
MRKGKSEPNAVLRYRLTDEEEAWLIQYRQQRNLLEQECLKAGIDKSEVAHYWYKSKMFSIFAKTKAKTIEDLKNELISGMSKYAPKYKPIKRVKPKDAHLLVIDPADIHIGKLCSEYETNDSYNSNIAVKRVIEGVYALLNRASMYDIDKTVLIIGNDILHTDTTRRTTTSGTPQDTDGQWYENFLTAKKLYVDVIEKLLMVSDVHVVHNPSNHDYMSGWYLAQTIEAWFSKNKNVTFDVSTNHRKAFVYHDNLIGSTHGDGAKNNDLPLLMAQEYKKEWAKTKHRYIYTHHVHHKTSKDYIGVTIESSRSASGTDSWHHRNGYQHAVKAIEAYIHHPTMGQIARITHKFD